MGAVDFVTGGCCSTRGREGGELDRPVAGGPTTGWLGSTVMHLTWSPLSRRSRNER